MDIKEGDVIVDRKTGERRKLVNGQWQTITKPAESVVDRAAEPAPVKESTSPTASGVLRGVSMGARDILTGAAGLPSLAADVATAPLTGIANLATAGYNKLTGGNVPSRSIIGGTQQALESALDTAGFAKPETDTERMLSAATRGVAGAATGMGAGGVMGATAPVGSNAQRIAQILKAAPKTQLAVGVTSPVAGETVRQAGGGPVAQTAAELATGLAVATPSVGMRQVPATATTDQLRAASKAAYAAAEQAGAVFKPAAYDSFVNSVVPEVRKAGFDATLHPKAGAVLTRLTDEMGKPQTLENMEILRRVAKIAAASPDKSERNIAGIIEDKLDNFVANAGPNDIMGGNPQIAVPALQAARKMYSQASKSATMETMLDRAELSAPNFSGSGLENAIRIEFKQLAKNEKKMRLYTAEEKEAIRNIAKGGPIENTLRQLGKFAPTGVVSTALSGGLGASVGGAAGAIGLPALGFAARQGATQIQKRNVELARALMAGGKLPAAGINREALAAALAAINAANASGQE